MRNFIFLGVVVLLSACQQLSFKKPEVEQKPLAAMPTPITKPVYISKPNPNSRDYTAPYPKLSAPLPTATKIVEQKLPKQYPIEGNVFQKAIELPPEQIKEGKYRTFKQIENDGLYDTRKIRSRIAEFVFPELKQVGQIPPKKSKPIYCYKSLSDSTCYSEPIAGQEFRRVGKLD